MMSDRQMAVENKEKSVQVLNCRTKQNEMEGPDL